LAKIGRPAFWVLIVAQTAGLLPEAIGLEASAYSLNNLNRGFSLSRPDGYRDGIKIENRYYFGYISMHRTDDRYLLRSTAKW
jgi:hypothetical protein